MITDNENIKKDDLTIVARKAEALSTLIADIEQDFFGRNDSEKYIIYNYKRLRRYIAMCFDLSHDLTSGLHDNGIWCFDREVVA